MPRSQDDAYGDQVKLCECGCGQPTRRKAKAGRGYKAGEFQRYVPGHSGRTRGQTKKKRSYSTWKSMKDRCLNPNSGDHHKYAARGIRICDRWLDFENFFADMGERPEGKTLDRIDNDGNYEPSNCRWATPKEQANNRRKRRCFRLADHPELTDDKYVEREQKRCQLREQPETVIFYSTPSEDRWPLPEAWEVAREREYSEPDHNQDVLDHYA